MKRHIHPLRRVLASLCKIRLCFVLCLGVLCVMGVSWLQQSQETVWWKGPGCERSIISSISLEALHKMEAFQAWAPTCFDTLSFEGREETTSHSVKVASTVTSALRRKQMFMGQSFLMEEKFQFLITSVFYNILKKNIFFFGLKLRQYLP